MHLTNYIIAGILFISAAKVLSADPVPADSTHQTAAQPAAATGTDTSAAGAITAVAPVDNATIGKKDSAESVSVKPAENAAIVEESEENLILDGGEESLLPTAPTTQAENVPPVPADSQNVGEAPASNAASGPVQSDVNAPAVQTTTPTAAPISPIQVPVEAEKPLQIEQAQSINFAKNFKEYRNPKAAILFSLLVPGAGQAYAHNYLKTSIFGAIEVTMITVGAVLRYQGGRKWNSAKKYANDHYSLDKFNDYYSKLTGHFTDSTIRAQIFEPDSNADYFISHAVKKDDDFYNSIRDYNSPYVRGWDDVAPDFDNDFNIVKGDHEGDFFFDEENPYLVYYINPAGDTLEFSRFGFSQHQSTFNDKLSSANNDYRWSQRVFTMLLINHIASAIDAGITAKAYNDRLLGKKTVWQRINLHDTYVQTPKGTAQGLALEVRF